MLTEFRHNGMVKSCSKYSDHNIQFGVSDVIDEVYRIEIIVNNYPTKWATWYPLSQELWIHDTKWLITPSSMKLPFFMPDLKNYAALLKKIKLYLIFS
jgi:hypothetical protein